MQRVLTVNHRTFRERHGVPRQVTERFVAVLAFPVAPTTSWTGRRNCSRILVHTSRCDAMRLQVCRSKAISAISPAVA